MTAGSGRQTKAELGGRLKARWEWAAVLGQVGVFAWAALNLRSARPPARPLAGSGQGVH